MTQNAVSKKALTKLWKQYKEEGSAEAKDKIIVHYLSLVKFIAGRMAMNSPSNVEEDDLIGWGVLGLLDAVEKFDLAQNVIFETYASRRVRGAIIDQIRSLDWAPRSLRQKARRLNRAKAGLKDQLGREPTQAEVAGEMEMTEDELFELTTDIHGAYIVSLDSTIADDSESGEVTLGEVTSDTTSPSPEESLARKEAERRLVEAIGQLQENERQVITLYYFDELTLKEIGAVLDLSESRICQIHRSVIRKLEKHLRMNP